MFKLVIPISPEGWDEKLQEFVEPKYQVLQLEHSLVSISKWESKWNKPFMTNDPKTIEESIDYIKCMTLTQNVDQEIYDHITDKELIEVNKYIEAPMTATTIREETKKGGNREVITSEVIYYYMIALNIPFECHFWHLNRLMTLIRVCSIKNQPAKKMGKKEVMSRNAALNAARKQKFNTNG